MQNFSSRASRARLIVATAAHQRESHSIDTSLPDFIASPQTFLSMGCYLSPATLNTALSGLCGLAALESVAGLKDLFSRLGEQFPNAFYPIEMLRLHEHRPQTSDRFPITVHRPQVFFPKRNWEFRHRQMQFVPGRRLKYSAAQCGGLADALGSGGEHDDVQFRGTEVRVGRIMFIQAPHSRIAK